MGRRGEFLRYLTEGAELKVVASAATWEDPHVEKDVI